MANKSRGARKAAQNKKTKEAHAAASKQYYDDLGGGERVDWGDIAYQAAGALPFVGGALAAKDLASGALGAGSAIGASGDVLEGASKAGVKAAGRGALAAAGTVAGIVGAADALKGAAELYNKKAYQEMTPEQQEKFRTRKSGRAATRKRELEGRENTPLERNSPLKQDPINDCLLYTSPSPRDRTRSRMPSSA